MVKAIVDTNILLRLITADDVELAQKAAVMIDAFNEGEVELREFVVAEVVYILSEYSSYKYSRKRVQNSLTKLLEIQQLRADKVLLVRALDTYATTKLDFADCLLVEHGKTRHLSVLTFDKKLKKISEKA